MILFVGVSFLLQAALSSANGVISFIELSHFFKRGFNAHFIEFVHTRSTHQRVGLYSFSLHESPRTTRTLH